MQSTPRLPKHKLTHTVKQLKKLIYSSIRSTSIAIVKCYCLRVRLCFNTCSVGDQAIIIRYHTRTERTLKDIKFTLFQRGRCVRAYWKFSRLCQYGQGDTVCILNYCMYSQGCTTWVLLACDHCWNLFMCAGCFIILSGIQWSQSEEISFFWGTRYVQPSQWPFEPCIIWPSLQYLCWLLLYFTISLCRDNGW